MADNFEEMHWEQYFTCHLELAKQRYPNGPIQLRDKCCGDCAVTTGLYQEFSDALKAMPEDLKEGVTKRWDCHNTPWLACRGNAENVGIIW